MNNKCGILQPKTTVIQYDITTGKNRCFMEVAKTTGLVTMVSQLLF